MQVLWSELHLKRQTSLDLASGYMAVLSNCSEDHAPPVPVAKLLGATLSGELTFESIVLFQYPGIRKGCAVTRCSRSVGQMQLKKLKLCFQANIDMHRQLTSVLLLRRAFLQGDLPNVQV